MTKIEGGIESLRAMAILAVLAHHLAAYSGFSVPFLGPNGGVLGVQLFFLVSGYLIVQSAEKYSLPVFFCHRFFRIFPPYLLILLAVLMLRLTLGHAYRHIWADNALYFALNLLNLQLFHPIAAVYLDVLHVSWTLTIELLWYGLAPLLVRWCTASAQTNRRWLILLLLFWGLAMVWVQLAQAGRLDFLYQDLFAAAQPPLDINSHREAIIVNAPPAQFGFFVVGACLYRFRESLLRLPSLGLWLVVTGSLPLLAQWNAALGFSPNPVSAVGEAALFALLVRIGSLGPVMAWFARGSYSLYLTHAVILVLLFALLGLSGPGALLAALALILIAGEVGFRYIETPSIRWGRRLAQR
jgi:peptidoglycan/LPS O-acetylase OafA/YrhL